MCARARARAVDPSKPTEPGWVLDTPEDVGLSDY